MHDIPRTVLQIAWQHSPLESSVHCEISPHKRHKFLLAFLPLQLQLSWQMLSSCQVSRSLDHPCCTTSFSVSPEIGCCSFNLNSLNKDVFLTLSKVSEKGFKACFSLCPSANFDHSEAFAPTLLDDLQLIKDNEKFHLIKIMNEL